MRGEWPAHRGFTRPSYGGSRQSNPLKGGCMHKGFIRLASLFAVFAALAIGGSAIATGAPTKPQKPAKAHVAKKAHAKKASAKKSSAKDSGETPEAAGAPECAAEDAAHAARCSAAGVTGDNVNYDDATGKCSLDTATASNQ